MAKTYLTAEAICAAARAMAGKYTYDQVDCIRVITNPLTAVGAKFAYIGSNYFARYEVQNLQRLTSASQIAAGKALFRSREPSESGYKLPDRYKAGGNCDTKDYRDYHHIGLFLGDGEIVDSNKDSMRDGPAISTNWKAWEWVADILKVDYGKEVNQEMEVIGKVKVVTPNGGYLNIRDVNGNDIGDILNGTTLPLLEKTSGSKWKVDYNGTIGYCATEFLQEQNGEATDTVAVSLPRETWGKIKQALANAGL